MNKLVTYVISVLVLACVGFVVFWFMIKDPFEKEQARLQNQIAEYESKIRSAKRKKKQIAEVNDKITAKRRQIYELLLGAKGRTLEDFLKELEEDAIAAKLSLESVRIEGITSTRLCSKIPLDIFVSGPYFKVFKFLSLLEKQGKLDMSSGRLNMSADNKEVKIENLKEYVDPDAVSKYPPGETFPSLRVNLSGKLIIITQEHINRYKTD